MEKNAREYLVARFETELGKVQRPGMDKLLAFIRKSDFYKAPASTRFHLSTESGLLQHSLNVLDALRGILTWNPDTSLWEYQVAGRTVDAIPDESLTIAALLHDICKTYFYATATRNVKNEKTKKWEKVPYFTVSDKMPLGHGCKSAMIIKEYTALTTKEMYMVWWHMGYTDAEGQDRLTLEAAIEMHPIILAMHTADMMASHFMEDTTENRQGFTLADADDETGEATMNEHLEAEASASEGPDYQDAPPVNEAQETQETPEAAQDKAQEPQEENHGS